MGVCSVARTKEWKWFEAISLPSDTNSNAHRGLMGGHCGGQPPSSSSVWSFQNAGPVLPDF